MTDLVARDVAVADQLAATGTPAGAYVLDIVIPVYNEERDLHRCVYRLHRFLADEVPYRSRITIADNASTDRTLAVARELADELPDVAFIHLDPKGRGAT